MSRKCIVCGVEIDPRRIAILPNTQTCTQHSTVEKKAAVTLEVISTDADDDTKTLNDFDLEEDATEPEVE